jgi:hypothetical protein
MSPAALDAAVADECRTLFGTVAGPEDAWLLHPDAARQVLALGGVPADELRASGLQWRAGVKSNASTPDRLAETWSGPDAVPPPDGW